MKKQKVFEFIKKSWNWVWNSDSILSWLVALVLIYAFVKFIFFPGISIALGTNLPLAGIESSSMDHSPTKTCKLYNYKFQCINYGNNYEICGKSFDKKLYFDFDRYWEACGKWYEERGISKEEFKRFSMSDGFSKGDVIIVWGRFKPKIGDIIIFKPNNESLAPRPIIHRIVKIDGETIQTKGDHNERQLTLSDLTKTDETNIKKDQIIGKAVFRIPLIGYLKIWANSILERILEIF